VQSRQSRIFALTTLLICLLTPPVSGVAAAEPSKYVVTVDGNLENNAVTGILHNSEPAHARLGLKNRHKFWTNIVIQPGAAKLSPTSLSDDLGGFYARFGAIGPDAEAVWDGQFTDTNPTLQIISTTPGFAQSNNLTAGILNILYGAMLILDATGAPATGSLADVGEAVKTAKEAKSVVTAAAALDDYPPDVGAFTSNLWDALTDPQQEAAILRAMGILHLSATKAQLDQLLVIPELADAMVTISDELNALWHQSVVGSATFQTVLRPNDGWLSDTHSFNTLIPRDFKFTVADPHGHVRVSVDNKLVIDTESDCGPIGVTALAGGVHSYQIQYRAGEPIPSVSYGTAFVGLTCAAPAGGLATAPTSTVIATVATLSPTNPPPAVPTPTPVPTATPPPPTATPVPALHSLDWSYVLTHDPDLRVERNASPCQVGDLYVSYKGGSPNWAVIDRILFGDIAGDGGEEAIIDLTACSLDSTVQSLIYRMTPFGPRIVTLGPGSGRFGMTITNGALEARTGIYGQSDPRCCPSGGIKVTQYRLQGNQLVEVNSRVIPPTPSPPTATPVSPTGPVVQLGRTSGQSHAQIGATMTGLTPGRTVWVLWTGCRPSDFCTAFPLGKANGSGSLSVAPSDLLVPPELNRGTYTISFSYDDYTAKAFYSAKFTVTYKLSQNPRAGSIGRMSGPRHD
jgi:hypothetical protein